MEKETSNKELNTPANGFGKALRTSENFVRTIGNGKPIKKAGAYWEMLGPGLTTGAADDDPSGIATYSQTGARWGFSLLWLAAFTFPLMAVVQEMCARIGLVTGRGLAGNIKRNYSKKVLYSVAVLLFLANTFNIGADLGAMAKATQLLWPNFSFTLLIVFFTVLSLGLQIFTSYKDYAKYLKWLALVLVSYVLTAFFVHINGREIFKYVFIPHLEFSREQIFLVCGILGTTISPYLFFWQTSQEVEEEILQGKTTLKIRQSETTDAEIKKMRVDIWSGMFFSNLAMFFIILTCGATLFGAGITNIQTAAEAAAALRPLAGNYAFLLFAVGIIGVGLLGVPVLAGSASYALSESFGWKQGLYRKFKRARAFYGVIILSMLIGLGLNFVGLDPIKALIYSAVANGIVAPIILVLIVDMGDNKKIMGNRTNGKTISAIGWITALVMIVTSVATIAALLIPG
ncbi:MAG: divalent metal cation transporter [Candidatus Doudnabacteria bacterium]|nr:divalent metal cation transporter [Candidatus Doudnabacteria bacterium]